MGVDALLACLNLHVVTGLSRRMMRRAMSECDTIEGRLEVTRRLLDELWLAANAVLQLT
jgi:hypothetical protein